MSKATVGLGLLLGGLALTQPKLPPLTFYGVYHRGNGVYRFIASHGNSRFGGAANDREFNVFCEFHKKIVNFLRSLQ